MMRKSCSHFKSPRWQFGAYKLKHLFKTSTQRTIMLITQKKQWSQDSTLELIPAAVTLNRVTFIIWDYGFRQISIQSLSRKSFMWCLANYKNILLSVTKENMLSKHNQKVTYSMCLLKIGPQIIKDLSLSCAQWIRNKLSFSQLLNGLRSQDRTLRMTTKCNSTHSFNSTSHINDYKKNLGSNDHNILEQSYPSKIMQQRKKCTVTSSKYNSSYLFKAHE